MDPHDHHRLKTKRISKSQRKTIHEPKESNIKAERIKKSIEQIDEIAAPEPRFRHIKDIVTNESHSPKGLYDIPCDNTKHSSPSAVCLSPSPM
jgi:hypothetical protein